MAFIRERVPEEDLDFLRKMKLKDCWGSRLLYVDGETKWCADRERNAYLVGIGGGYKDMPKFTDFWWNGTIIRMETTIREVRNAEETFDVNWYIHKIPIPKNVWKYKTDIMKMIEDAFSVNTSWVDNDKVNSIKVNFRCEAEMVKGKQWWESRI